MSKTISHHFLEARKRARKQIALKYKEKNVWKSIRWADYFSTSEKIAGALKLYGVQTGDRVAILSNTRVEWVYTDSAILGIGAITVPIYQSHRPDELEYILNNSEAKILFCENKEQLKKWLEIQGNCNSIEKVIVMSATPKIEENFTPWEELLKDGDSYCADHPQDFEKLCQARSLDEDATILYTSGTTGEPKGVVLQHKQIMSEIEDAFGMLSVGLKDSTLSFLPYAHILGRIEVWGNIYAGYTLCFAENVDRIRVNLREIKPTIMIAVPRIFEKIYNGVLAQAETSPLIQKIFNWSVDIGKKVSQCKLNKKPIPISLLSQYLVAKKLVFDKFNEKLGGRMRFAVSGGAPLSKDIGEFFHAADFLILEGYGLTETTAAICLNTPFDYEFGTVGKPVGDVEIKIAKDGEILIKSEKVMKEYYKNPEATSKAIVEGYFATGDIGSFTESGCLKITDRKKDLIKTAGGKYIAPQRLEGLLKLNKYVSNVLIHGDQKKYVVALVTLDQPSVESFALENQISYQNPASLAQNAKIKGLIRDAVAEVNSQVASYESIKNFHILGEDFTIESGELTPSLKVKRKHCDQKYSALIDQLYGVDTSAL